MKNQILNRFKGNPILTPDETNNWEARAVFNASVVKDGDNYHALYRAVSSPIRYYEQDMEISTIGYAGSKDGYKFGDRRKFITPDDRWDRYGCEDPRVTKIGDKYYIFYTALSNFPHTAEGIRVGLVITKDFKHIDRKFTVTPFNAKAMALFSEKINGKYAAVLSVDTDKPPSVIAIKYFNDLHEIESVDLWEEWYEKRQEYKLELKRNLQDHVEVGAVPVRTDKGWLLVYSYIRNYFTPTPVFGIEAALLDMNDPTKIIANTNDALLTPVEEYELYGMVNNIVFPTSALLEEDKLRVYYGAADTVVCLAEGSLKSLFDSFDKKPSEEPERLSFKKYKGNPIIEPKSDNNWEASSTFNPTAVLLDGKVHILYRALSSDNTSAIGYAASEDGFSVTERLDEPIYDPREEFELKIKEDAYSGCEDARVTLFEDEDKLYMCYTAYSGVGKTAIAFTSISTEDFKAKRWKWEKPRRISDISRDDKNACIFPRKVDGKYILFHRIGGCMWLDMVDDLKFNDRDLGGRMVLCPKKETWTSRKVGIAGPPIETKEGWLLVYHGLSKSDDTYRLSAMLLDLDHPYEIISELGYPLIEPTEDYEKEGLRHKTVFSCGGVVKDGKLIVYYGGADKVVGAASIEMDKLLSRLAESKS
jgi:predicted GH43/DUF377 family glycosyl hydrolase